MQSKKASLIEALLNQFVAFFLALGMYHYIVPVVTGIPTTAAASTIVVLMFTVLSLVRSYTIRRLFNKHHAKANS